MNSIMSQSNHQQCYPVFLDLHDRKVLVIGDGATAARKISRLIRQKPQLSLVSEHPDTDLQSLCKKFALDCKVRAWTATDLVDCTLVFAATESKEQNLSIARIARETGCLVNVADQPEHSDFLVPSLIDRYPLLIAVSSTGTSPVLARIIRARISALFPESYRDLAAWAQRHRERINSRISKRRFHRRFWESLLGGRIGESILQGRLQEADAQIEQALNNPALETNNGEVYLVGAGPGDPDLLSFRALRLMQQCDVVLYDRLVSDQIMALVNKDAQRLYVGKRRNEHTLPQESINQQLARLAIEGHRVLRLKGGDPFMFGRGGEEIETLAAAGVAFQVVPGITAAGGCASYAGIPLTHREHAQACVFVTGHLKNGTVNLDWQALARRHQTLVIYMGLVGLPVICSELIRHGLPPDQPIALIAQGTRVEQHVVTGTLDTMPEIVANSDIKPPTLIIIGTVVNLRNQLSWFENRN